MAFTFKLSQRLARVRPRGLVAPAVALAIAAVAACELPTRPPVAGARTASRLAVSPRILTLQQNEATDLMVVGFTSAGDTATVAVTWSATSGTIIDTSSNSGRHYGRYKAGSDTGRIKVVVQGNPGGAADTAVVTVTLVPAASVTVSPAAASVTVGQSSQLTATPKDASGNSLTGRVVTWATSNASVASVSATGMVSSGAVGSVTITATSEGRSGTASITVTNVPVASVSVSPAPTSVAVGQTVQLTATARDAGGNPLSGRVVTWASSVPAMATVSGSGLVTGVSAGSTTITATSEGRSGTAAATVTATVTNPGTVMNLAVASVTTSSVTLSFTEVTDGAGQAAKYDIRWAAGTLSWASANSVTQGTCTTPVAGTVIGATRSCTVLGLGASTGYQFQLVAFRGTLNVDAVFGGMSNVASGTTVASTAPVASVTMSPAFGSIVLGQTLQLTATLRDASGNTLTGRPISWTSGAPLQASVSSNGLVTGLLAGTPTITATSEGRSGSATITVSVLPPPGTMFPNEPAGLTVIQEASWESGLLGAWFRKFTSADKPITIVPITDSPLGETQALEIGFNQGHQGGGGTELEFGIPVALRPREMFVGYYVQVSPNWQGHSSGINKMVYLGDGGANFSAMWYEMFGSGGSALGLYVVNQSGSGPAGMHETGPVNFTRGQWHKVEIHQRQGSPGVIRIWVDGVLALDRADVFTRDAPIDMVTISGIWGGIGDVKAHADYMRFDRIRISGR